MNISLKCDVTCSWTPSPVTNCHTFSDPSPSCETYFMYGPYTYVRTYITCMHNSGCSTVHVRMHVRTLTHTRAHICIHKHAHTYTYAHIQEQFTSRLQMVRFPIHYCLAGVHGVSYVHG